MSEQKKPGHGYIAKNSYKTKPEHPDWKGKFKLNDIEYTISGWDKKDNPDLFTISVTEAIAQQKMPNNSNVKSNGGNSKPQTESFDPDDLFGSIPGG